MIFNNLSRIFTQLTKGLASADPAVLHTTDAEALKLLGRYFNVKHLESIVDQGRASIAPKSAQHPVPEAGLLAIAAYTSAGLDRFIHEAHSPMGGPRHRREDIKLLESLIFATLPMIASSPAGVVKRNLTLNPEAFRSTYRPGATVRFDRITSVTLQPHQVYRGGNVDLSIETLTGVVDVSALSTFSGAHARGEKEGLLLPGQMYRVLQTTPGRESSPLDPPVTEKATHAEQWRVLLRECEDLTKPGGE